MYRTKMGDFDSVFLKSFRRSDEFFLRIYCENHEMLASILFVASLLLLASFLLLACLLLLASL